MSSTADPTCPKCENLTDCISVDMYDTMDFDGDQVQLYAQHTCQHCEKEMTVIWYMTVHTVEVEA